MAEKYEIIRWPLGKFKNYDVRTVPVSVLNWFLDQPIRIDNKFWMDWRDIAIAELERRHSYQVKFHFSEHLYERFTQYWPKFIIHYQNLIDKNAGVVTILRRLFARALANGIAIPDPNDKTKYIILDKNYRWIYVEYLDKKLDNFKAITITKVTK